MNNRLKTHMRLVNPIRNINSSFQFMCLIHEYLHLVHNLLKLSVSLISHSSHGRTFYSSLIFGLNERTTYMMRESN